MQLDVDTRLIAYVVWGIGTTLIYGFVMDGRYRSWLRRKDRRARREFSASVALFGTALCANLAILVALFSDDTDALRGFLVAVALGAFFAAGIVMATDRGGYE